MKYNILLVEDEHKIAEGIMDYISGRERDAGYDIEFTWADNGDKALEFVYENEYDLVLLDIMLPGADGFEICRAIRAKSYVPIIFLTARGREEDILYGYDLGCDDYVVKPFAIAELYAKSVALVRRAKGTVIHRELVCGLISCDTSALTVTVDSAAVDMPRKELELLTYLMENRKRVVSRDELLVNIWGYDYDGRARVVDDHIRKLRKALGKAAGQIKTVITKGYQIKDV